MKNSDLLRLSVFLALLCVFNVRSTHLSAASPAEIGALIALYDATDGNNWVYNTNWKNGMDPCNVAAKWFGVTCDGSGNVTKIDLQNNGLNGAIPVELGNLSNLQHLILFINQVSGNIPAQLGNLSQLRSLYLFRNQLSGHIPAELGNLANLEYLGLSNNQLTGSIPVELGNLYNLLDLNLFSNQLSGGIPAELGDLSYLKTLWIGLNQLSGGIPPALGALSSLELLGLNGNPLGGGIPVELGNLSNLKTLSLISSQLTGNIPSALGNLSNLEKLYLGGNQLSGRLPPELGNLSVLEQLTLYNNQLTGGIPVEWGNLTNLKRLYLQNNKLSGCFPHELQVFCSLGFSNDLNQDGYNFTNNPGLPWQGNFLLFCNGENQTGAPCNDGNPNTENDVITADCECGNTIIESCRPQDSLSLVALYNATDGANWTNTWNLNLPVGTWYGVTSNEEGCVTDLYLNSNGLNGFIPPELGNLSYLENLSLRSNQLSGSIPAELGNYTRLSTMDLNFNQLSGNIPPELGNLTTVRYFSISYCQLSGSIPPELGNLTNATYFALLFNQLTGSIPPELGNLANLSKLVLKYNQLSGSIPPEIGHLTNLTILWLEYNQLSGSIPLELGNLSNLTDLRLNNNQLNCFETGLQALCSSPNLTTVTVQNNPGNLDWNAFCSTGAGSCPDNEALITLYNATDGDNWTNNANWLNGMDPCNAAAPWYGVTCDGSGNVTQLALSENNLVGFIPAELGNLTHLSHLDLHENLLTGTIPVELSYLNDLEVLNLAINELSGDIPTELGDLTNLRELYLAVNQLTGTIPRTLGDLTNLTRLELAYNQLGGSIPSQLINLSSLQWLFLNDNQLDCFESGLSSLCNSGTLAEVRVNNNPGNLDWGAFCATGAGSCGGIHPLEIWLNNHPPVAQAITWNVDKDNNVILPYYQWPEDLKTRLHDLYDNLMAGIYPDFPDPLNNINADPDGYPYTVLSASVARHVFFSFLATSLYYEINNRFPWSILDFSPAALSKLYNWNEYYTVSSLPATNYQPEFIIRFQSTPAPPSYLKTNFVDLYNIVDDTDKLTYANILEFARDNMIHFAGSFTADNAYNHWQYFGVPPMSRVIEGTTRISDSRFAHFTYGCHGTVSFTKWLGFMLNIPVIDAYAAGHRIAILPSVDSLFITHGDDPYGGSSKDPLILGRHFLVEKVHFDDWFGAGTASPLNNVARRNREISMNQLPRAFLGAYCNDYNNTGATEEDNYLANNYAGLVRSFPPQLMDSLHFWDRLHLKLKSLPEYQWCFASYNEPIDYEAYALAWDYLGNAVVKPDTSIFKADLPPPMRGSSNTYLMDGDWVEMVLYNSVPETWLGLSMGADPSLSEMSYAIQMKNNVVKVFENGQVVATLHDEFKMSVNWLKIGMEDGMVKYSLNGFVRYQHPVTTPGQRYIVYFGAEERESEINNIYTSSTKVDSDHDGIDDVEDNCPSVYNPLQEDLNENGIGDICEEVLKVSPVIYLQGPYDPETGLMSDHLRTSEMLPLVEPYSALGYTHIGGGGEETEPFIFDFTGPDAIVDWVFLELRDKNDHSIVVATRSALLRRDGNVVDVDGYSPVSFAGLSSDEYYLAIKHRNHLGAMSGGPTPLYIEATTVFFTTDPSQTYGGANGIAALPDGKYGLFSGDFNGNGQVQNTDFIDMVQTLGLAGYEAGDFDLNGQVQNTDLQLKLVPNIGRGAGFE